VPEWLVGRIMGEVGADAAAGQQLRQTTNITQAAKPKNIAG
jgi:hypothetical protein